MPSPYIVKANRSRRMRWAGSCGTHGAEETCMLGFGENIKESDRFEDLSVDGSTILKTKSNSLHPDQQNVQHCFLDTDVTI